MTLQVNGQSSWAIFLNFRGKHRRYVLCTDASIRWRYYTDVEYELPYLPRYETTPKIFVKMAKLLGASIL